MQVICGLKDVNNDIRSFVEKCSGSLFACDAPFSHILKRTDLLYVSIVELVPDIKFGTVKVGDIMEAVEGNHASEDIVSGGFTL